jgi:hypothetical protein
LKRLRDIVVLIALSVVLAASLSAANDRGVSVRPAAPGGGDVVGDQWLLVIGIDAYLHWPRLKTAVNDARAVKDVLLERYHFEERHLIELYDAQATRKNIIAALRRLATQVGKDDSLVIFYAGHGHLDAITKEGSWIPVESGTQEASAWISNHSVKNYLKVDAIKARHILLISDSCFAGDFFRGHRGRLPDINQKVVQKAYQLTSRQAVTSGGLEPVSDAGFGDNSVFSHFLVKALKENRSPFTVPSMLFPQIKAGVAENAEQFPQFGALKGTGGQQGGELVLFLRQASRLDALNADSARKTAELDRLRRMEAEAEAAKRKENVEITRRERELAELDTKIAEIRDRLGTPAETDDSLDTMLAMVRKKEARQRHLDQLKAQRETAAARREAEIARLQMAQAKARHEDAEADIAKYEEIIASPYGKDMQAAAWSRLVSRYPEAAAVAVGDVAALRVLLSTREARLRYQLQREANPAYEPAVAKLLKDVRHGFGEGFLKNSFNQALYDKYVTGGSGGMGSRAKRLEAARKRVRIPEKLTFRIVDDCAADYCVGHLSYVGDSAEPKKILEIPADFSNDQVRETVSQAFNAIALDLIQRYDPAD